MLIDYGFVNKKYAIVSQFFGQFMKEAGSRQAVIQGGDEFFRVCKRNGLRGPLTEVVDV
jgi:hypothetical protein